MEEPEDETKDVVRGGGEDAKDIKKQVTFKLKKDTAEQLARAAKAAKCTQASIVDDALREYLLIKDDSEPLEESIEEALSNITNETEKIRKRIALRNAHIAEMMKQRGEA